jgi:TonB family protein
MIRQKNKSLCISCVISILLHTLFLSGMIFFHESSPGKPVKTSRVVYKAGLEYTQVPVEKRKGTNSVKETKPLPGENSRGKMDPGKAEKKAVKGPEASADASREKEKRKPDIAPETDQSIHPPGKDTLPDHTTCAYKSYTGFTLDEKQKKDTPGRTSPQGNDDAVNRDIVFNLLNEKIKKNKLYPPSARQRGVEGTVVVFFIINEEGSLVTCRVEKSSGYSILDRAALNVIRRSLPYPHILDKQLEFKIAIMYELKG